MVRAAQAIPAPANTSTPTPVDIRNVLVSGSLMASCPHESRSSGKKGRGATRPTLLTALPARSARVGRGRSGILAIAFSALRGVHQPLGHRGIRLEGGPLVLGRAARVRMA